MSWAFSVVKSICALLWKVQQREKQWSWESPHENSIWFCQLFTAVLCFQKLSHLKQGNCLATKHNCHLSQPEDIELKMSVRRGGRERRAQPFLSWKIIYLNSPTKPQGMVAAMQIKTIFILLASVVQKWSFHRQSIFLISGVVALWLSHSHCAWMGINW